MTDRNVLVHAVLVALGVAAVTVLAFHGDVSGVQALAVIAVALGVTGGAGATALGGTVAAPTPSASIPAAPIVDRSPAPAPSASPPAPAATAGS